MIVVKYDFPVLDDYELLFGEERLEGNIVRRTIHGVHHINIGPHSFTYFKETFYTKVNHPYYSFSVSLKDVMNVRILYE